MRVRDIRRRLYAVEFGLARGAVAAIQAMPLETGLAVGERLGDLIYACDPRHSRVALSNLRAVYPELPEREIVGMAKASFRSLARAALEFAYSPRLLTPRRWQHHIDFPDCDRALELSRSGGAILATGHLGNWEVAGTVLGFLGLEVHSIVRPFDNPYVNEYAMRLRLRGQRIIYKQGAVRRMSELLRRGETLGFLVDQNAGTRGCFCNFLGRQASTTVLPALLARRIGVPILPGYSLRLDGALKFRVHLGQLVHPDDYAHLPADVAIHAMTQEVTRQIEEGVRKSPTQWMWMHRRWKTRPPAEVDAKTNAVDASAEGEAGIRPLRSLRRSPRHRPATRLAVS